MSQIFKMAIRNLGRNKRRSALSSLAVSVGMSLMLLLAAVVEGEMRGALQNTIRLQSGHVQVRALGYDENKVSLKWEDLIASPQQLIEKINTIPQVAYATPRLLASGIISLKDKSRGVQVVGIDPGSPATDLYREGLLAGQFIEADDHEGILVGSPLAKRLGLRIGDKVNLLINRSSGDTDEQVFTIRGIYTTNNTGYDESTIFMPLSKAQSFAGAEDHVSLIFIMLEDQEQASLVADALTGSNYQIRTWQEMNKMIVELEDFAGAYMYVLYLIVLGITATVVVNTLVMAVFERTREIGILTAIGMKGARIMSLFLVEGGLLATGGVIGGLILGGLAVAYFTRYGIYFGDYGMTGILMGDTIYAHLTLQDAVSLTIITYGITLVSSLYPAVLAARMEPVEALHGK